MPPTAEFSILPRLQRLALPPCDNATAFVVLLTSHPNTNNATTELTKHNSAVRKMETQLQLTQVLLHSLRLAESRCRRRVLLLMGAREHKRVRVCRKSGCRTWRVYRSMLGADPNLEQHVVAPLIAGSPASDKLHVFNLTRYRALVVLDSDMLVLQDMPELFGEEGGAPPPPLMIANHPYDHAQGALCGVPLAMRGVTALFALTPNRTTFDTLVLNHWAEQQAMCCLFHRRRSLRTLPCGYVYDLSTPRFAAGKQGFARCLAFAPDSGRLDGHLGRRSACEEVSRHVQAECLWERIAPRAHALHFKGTFKPWSAALSAGGAAARRCTAASQMRRMRLVEASGRPLAAANGSADADGRPGSSAGTAVASGVDEVRWDAGLQACVSVRRRRPLVWASGQPVGRDCCVINVMMAVEWRALRADYCEGIAAQVSPYYKGRSRRTLKC